MSTRETTRMVSRLAGFIALAVLASGCGLLAGPSEREVVASMIGQSTAVSRSLSAAVNYSVTSGSTMSAEARVLTEKLESDLTAFNDLSDDLRSTDEIGDAAQSFAQTANLAASLLSDGQVDVAAEVNRTQVDPIYTTLQSLLSSRQEEIGEPGGSSGWIGWVFGLGIVAFVAYVIIQRRRPTLEDLLAQPNAVAQPELTPEPGANDNRRKRPVPLDQRTTAETNPVAGLELPPPIGDATYAPPQPEPSQQPRFGAPPSSREPVARPEPAGESNKAPAGPIRNPEALHSVRGGLRTVELRGVIDAALATMVDAGWEVAIECPDVSVLVDPLRMRRLLSNLLLSATAHDAEHIGLVAVIVGDRVEVNVGHDGSLLDGLTDPTETPPEVDHQLTVARQLLAGMHADARWSDWRGVSLYTIELVRGPDEVEGHDVPAAASAD